MVTTKAGDGHLPALKMLPVSPTFCPIEVCVFKESQDRITAQEEQTFALQKDPSFDREAGLNSMK